MESLTKEESLELAKRLDETLRMAHDTLLMNNLTHKRSYKEALGLINEVDDLQK